MIETLNEEKYSLEIELKKAEEGYKNMKSGMRHESVKETEEPDKPVTEQEIKEGKYEDIILNKKEGTTIPVEVLTKMLDESEELKNNRQKEWQFKPLQHNKNIEIYRNIL